MIAPVFFGHSPHIVQRIAYWCLPILMVVAVGNLLPERARAQSKIVSEFSMESAIVTVPFKYVQHQILLHGEVNGKRDLTLLLDTGAALPIMDIGVNPTGFNLPNRTIQEADGRSRIRTIVLDDISVGDGAQRVHAHNIVVGVSDLTQISARVGTRIDGIVGLSFLTGFVVEIDYALKTIRFMSPQRCDISDRKPDNLSSFLLPLANSSKTNHFYTLAVTGKLPNDFDYEFLLDTGFGGYVSIAKPAAQLCGLLKGDTPRVRGESYSLTHRYSNEKIRVDFLMLGDINLSNRVIQVDARNGEVYGQNGIIGNRLLQNYKITLDTGRRKLWLERATKREELDDAEKPTLGMSVEVSGKVIRVIRVAPHSPAALSGVKVGDVILSVDGVTIDSIGIATALSILAAPDGPTDLEVKRASGAIGIDPKLTFSLLPAPALSW